MHTRCRLQPRTATCAIAPAPCAVPLDLPQASSYITALVEGDAPDSELTSDALTDRVRVLQRRRGHRFSYDDVITAWVAAHEAPRAGTHLDLGCGIGSVLLMLADRLPGLRSVGIEAQSGSFALAQRNVAASGLAERVRVVHGDLRDPELPSGPFDLVTGTPPYKPPGTATPSPDAQRAYARVELRGGVEQYLEAAARVLAPEGVCVVCMETPGLARVQLGAAAAGLSIQTRLDVIPRAGRGALFSVFSLRRELEPPRRRGTPNGEELGSADVTEPREWPPRAGTSAEPTLGSLAFCGVLAVKPSSSSSSPVRHSELVLRDAAGHRTAEARALRTFFGLPNPEHEQP